MSALSDHMALGCATVCRAWIVRRVDGMVLGFTDHDLELNVEGVTCHAASGMTAGALQTSTGLAVDNAEAQGALSHDAIRAEDIRAGLWDAAEVTTYLVNWQAPTDFEVLFHGSLGEISLGGSRFHGGIAGLSAIPQHGTGTSVSIEVRCGSWRCAVSSAVGFVVCG